MAADRSPKPEVVLSQRGWRYHIEIWHAIDFRLLKQMPSLNLNPEVDFRFYGRHIEKSI